MPREHGFNKPCYWLILTKSLIPRNSLWLVYDLSDLETSMNIRNKIDQEIKIYVSPSRISIIHQSWNYSFYYLFITLHLFIISLSLSRSSSRFNHASKISSFHAFSKFLNVPYMNIYIYTPRDFHFPQYNSYIVPENRLYMRIDMRVSLEMREQVKQYR